MSDKSGKDAAAPSSSAAALLNQPIVLDTGTGTTRAGFAGGTKPKVCSYVYDVVLICDLKGNTRKEGKLHQSQHK